MRWQMHAVFLAAASLARAGSITGSDLFVDVKSVVTAPSNSDSVTYTDSFFLTIGGGSGTGFFAPQARVQNTWLGTEASRASVEITCGTGCGGMLHTDYSNSTTYYWSSSVGLLPFTYGVAMPIVLTVTAANCCAQGLMSEASINGFTIYDPRTNQTLRGADFAIVGAEAPEPNSFWLLAPLAVSGLAVRRRRLSSKS